MEVKTVGIACDHAGFPLKQFVLEYLEKKGLSCKGLWYIQRCECRLS